MSLLHHVARRNCISGSSIRVARSHHQQLLPASFHRNSAATRCTAPRLQQVSTNSRFNLQQHRCIQHSAFSSAPRCSQAQTTTAAASSSSSSTASSTRAPTYDPSQLTGVLHDLHDRGMIADMTHSSQLSSHLQSPRLLYAGFDPTASSLHIGNLLVLMVLRRFQKYGHKPICVVGGATGMIGDPSGRSTERTMMSEQQLKRNIEGITKDIEKFLTFESGSTATSTTASSSSSSSAAFTSDALLLNNSSWFSSLLFLPFLRDICRHFRLGSMLARDSVSSRMGTDGEGISLTELSYQVLQAYDFSVLWKERDVSLQVGGSDQYGNITAGIELIKRQAAFEKAHASQLSLSVSAASSSSSTSTPTEPQVFGLTLPLLTTSTGAKFGKSAGNAPIWLAAPSDGANETCSLSSSSSPTSASQTSTPYQLYQYFLSTPDIDVVRYLKLFTDYELSEITQLQQQYASKPQDLVRILAEAVTRLVHGEKGLQAAKDASATLFGAKNKPMKEMTYEEFMEAFKEVETAEIEMSETQPLTASSTTSSSSSSSSTSPNSSSSHHPPTLVDLCVRFSLCKTKAEVRRLITNGGLYLNGEKVESEKYVLDVEKDLWFGKRVLLLRVGKKRQLVVKVKQTKKECNTRDTSTKSLVEQEIEREREMRERGCC